ncbi:MAG: hypothetical protein WCW14_04790 [Candidatus Paceibacterota bacterium]|jgi:hypothetical protein
MNLKELGIQAIRPLAILYGGLNGVLFMAEIVKEDGTFKLYSLSPPDYDLARAVQIEDYILDSAVEKHGFIPTRHESIISFDDYEKYLREINQLPHNS